jgi:hypothetical protein
MAVEVLGAAEMVLIEAVREPLEVMRVLVQAVRIQDQAVRGEYKSRRRGQRD